MKLYLPLFVFLSAAFLFAQDNPKAVKVQAAQLDSLAKPHEEIQQSPEHHFLDTPVLHGFYGAPILKSANIGPGGTSSFLAGAQVGWILNKKYVISLNVTGLASRVKAPKLEQVDGLVLIMNYIGLNLSYIRNSNDLLHVEAGSLVGIGQAFYRDAEYRARYNQIDAYIIIEPEVRLMLNVIPGFRMGAGLSYRYTDRVDLLGLSDSSLSGLSLNMIFKIGKF